MTRRGDAHHELASAGKQLLGNKDCERRANHAANNADDLAGELERVEFGMIARPRRERLCRSGLSQLPHQVAIGIQNADRRHLHSVQPLLSPCLTEQGCRGENRRPRRVLVV